jgi:predicted Zn finger-like uncharacterized protein
VNVTCQDCRSVFRVDPAKVPPNGVRARCSVCGAIIRITVGSSTPLTSPAIVARAATPSRVTPMIPATPASIPSIRRSTPMSTEMPETGTPYPSRPTPSVSTPPFATPAFVMPAIELPTLATPIAALPTIATPETSLPAIDAIPMHTPAAAFARPLVPPPPPSPGQMVGGEMVTPLASAAVGPSTASATPDSKRVINPFLRSDPMTRARRLARALVSDMVAYQPAKRADGLANGTLKQLFRDEIRKSYDEYVEQVGREVAESTAFFQDALNDVLAEGRRVF